ncbi:MAG: hypothetical protein IKN55_05150 [Oscillospiraceae bacterium]|nr:hypothetical protein [Oscillospiraceae bacterium]
MKKLFALLAATAMLLCSVPLPAVAEDTTGVLSDVTEDVTSKLSQELRDELALQTGLIPVGIWRKAFTEEEIVNKTGEFLPENYEEITDEAERTDAWLAARRTAVKELYLPSGEALLDDLGVTGENRGFISMFTPLITCKLTPAQIQQAAERDDVATIYHSGKPSYADFETVFVVTEKTEDSAHLFQITPQKLSDGLYAVLSDEKLGKGYFAEHFADYAGGDILLYTGGYWYTGENGAAAFDRMKGSFRKIGTLTEHQTIADAVQKTDTGYVLQNKDDVQTYALQLARQMKAEFGDVNYDGSINASDAAIILIDAAERGALATARSTDTERDINGDSDVNASDAALVLGYAAALGAKATTLTLPSYLLELDHTVMRISVVGERNVTSGLEILDSEEALTTYFTEKYTPRETVGAGFRDWLSSDRRDPDAVRSEIQAVYDAAFFAEHHLAAIPVTEGDLETLPEVRRVAAADGGSVLIDLCHKNPYGFGSAMEGSFVVLAAVGKDVTDPAQIMVNNTQEYGEFYG